MSGPPPMTPRPEYPAIATRQRFSVTGEAQGPQAVDIVSYIGLMPKWRFHPRRNCRGMDPNDFFGSDDMAKTVCPGCPVLVQCQEWAVENGEFGVWGGTSERGRRMLRRRLKLPVRYD